MFQPSYFRIPEYLSEVSGEAEKVEIGLSAQLLQLELEQQVTFKKRTAPQQAGFENVDGKNIQKVVRRIMQILLTWGA